MLLLSHAGTVQYHHRAFVSFKRLNGKSPYEGRQVSPHPPCPKYVFLSTFASFHCWFCKGQCESRNLKACCVAVTGGINLCGRLETQFPPTDIFSELLKTSVIEVCMSPK